MFELDLLSRGLHSPRVMSLYALSLLSIELSMASYSNARRGSIWPAGNQATAPSGSQQGGKDPRPLRDRPFQAKMRQDVVTWLISNGYEIPPQVLQNITNKDCRGIFQHLITLLDPSWPFNPDGRFDEEFTQALRAVKYPYLSQIDLRWLATPGTMHAWPSLLGLLHWLAEMGSVSPL